MQKKGRIATFQERREPYPHNNISTYVHNAKVLRASIHQKAFEHKQLLQEPRRK